MGKVTLYVGVSTDVVERLKAIEQKLQPENTYDFLLAKTVEEAVQILESRRDDIESMTFGDFSDEDRRRVQLYAWRLGVKTSTFMKTGDRKTVLVVDDEESWRKGTKVFLENLGCEVLLASSIDEAKFLALENSVHATLIEYFEGAGIELVAWLAANNFGGKLVAHSYSGEENRKMVQFGCGCFVSKGWDEHQRVSSLMDIL